MAAGNDLPPEDEFEEFDEDFDLDDLFDEEDKTLHDASDDDEESEEENEESLEEREESLEEREESLEEKEEAKEEPSEEPISAEETKTEEAPPPLPPPATLPFTEEGPSLVSPEEIPVSIAVEITRLQIDVKTLMELEPGNMLQLNTSPNEGVNLVAGDKILGKGELIRVGDLLGVRILDIGK